MLDILLHYDRLSYSEKNCTHDAGWFDVITHTVVLFKCIKWTFRAKVFVCTQCAKIIPEDIAIRNTHEFSS